MKRVKVKYLYLNDDNISEGILIENLDDVKTLEAEYGRAENRVITKFVNSGESSNRYDHVLGGLRPTERPLAQLAVAYGSIHEKNPIYMLPIAKEMALNSVRSSLLRLDCPVFMNKNGGFCPTMNKNKDGELEDYLEIVEEKEFESFDHQVRYYMRKNTKYLNLENDWELERDAVKWLETKDRNFSYITELSTLTLDWQLPKLIKEFIDNGGTHIYVYTTGQNYKQMYDYSKTAIKAGIENFVFDFNSGMDEHINEFITWLKSRANVEVLNKKK